MVLPLRVRVGGLLFGVGMVMTRGCASRLLILSANGNLRALLSGLVFAVTAQATLAGSLAPLRSEIAGWWTVEGGSARNLLALVGAAFIVAGVLVSELKLKKRRNEVQDLTVE
mgnify:CR=1 FL=1